MKSLLIPLALAAAFIIAVGLFTQNVENFKKAASRPRALKTITIEDKEIKVEVADTEIFRNKGLGEKESLGENEGMLFVFEKENITPSFWMKDMKFAIDIIWIDDEKIVQIDEDVQPPEPKTPSSALKMYSPNQPVDYVLEVNAGYVNSNGVEIGDFLDLKNL